MEFLFDTKNDRIYFRDELGDGLVRKGEIVQFNEDGMILFTTEPDPACEIPSDLPKSTSLNHEGSTFTKLPGEEEVWVLNTSVHKPMHRIKQTAKEKKKATKKTG